MKGHGTAAEVVKASLHERATDGFISQIQQVRSRILPQNRSAVPSFNLLMTVSLFPKGCTEWMR